MTATAIFLADLGITAGISLAVVAYLRRHLNDLLAELCGTAERAKFWSAFSNVALILVPLIFALQYQPELSQNTTAVLEMGSQLKWALVGLVVTLVTLGTVVGRFIPRNRPASGNSEVRMPGSGGPS